MTITVQEKQELIDNKDWDALVKTDLFLDFTYGVTVFKQYTFDRDFVVSFVFDAQRFAAHTKHVIALGTGNLYDDDIFKNILSRRADLGIKLSTQDWKDVISTVDTLYSDKTINSRACAAVLTITGKDVDYLRVLLDDKMVAKLSRIAVPAIGRNMLNAEEFTKLTPEEQRIVAPLLAYSGGWINVENGDVRVFANVTKDYKELNNISQRLMINIGSILFDLAPDEYIKVLLDLIDEGETVTAVSWLPYFSEHLDYEITDEQFKKLFARFGADVFAYMINNVPEKAIEENRRRLQIGYLVNRQSMSLERISELMGHAKTDLSGYERFFTEEEIVKHPYFFNPAALQRRAFFYVSHETFKILNKTWGVRKQYNEGLADFATIVKDLPRGAVTTKTLRYLKEKTNVSNEIVTSTILSRPIDGGWGKEAKKLYIVKNFITKFSQ